MKQNKKKWTKRIGILAAAVMVIGALAGCGSTSDTTDSVSGKAESTEPNSATTLNIAYQPVVGFLSAYLLKDGSALQDALKEAGYDVEVTFTEFESGPPENEAFASNLQDIGVMGNVPAISGIAAGQQRSIIGIAYNGEQTEAVLVPEDSAIKAVSDLKGKKVGLVIGSIAQNYMNELLKANGLSLDDIELINLSTGEQQQALATGQVDAVATWEPTITKIEAAGAGKVLADGTGVFLGENPIVARTEYVEQNPEIVKIFLEQYQKAAEEIVANPEAYAEKYAEQLGLEQDLFVTALSHVDFPVTTTEDDITDLQGTADFLHDSGIITKTVTVKDYIK